MRANVYLLPMHRKVRTANVAIANESRTRENTDAAMAGRQKSRFMFIWTDAEQAEAGRDSIINIYVLLDTDLAKKLITTK